MAMKATWCRVPGCKMTGDHCLALKLNLENTELEFVGGSGYGHGEMTCHTPKLIEPLRPRLECLPSGLDSSSFPVSEHRKCCKSLSSCKSYWNIGQIHVIHGQCEDEDFFRGWCMLLLKAFALSEPLDWPLNLEERVPETILLQRVAPPAKGDLKNWKSKRKEGFSMPSLWCELDLQIQRSSPLRDMWHMCLTWLKGSGPTDSAARSPGAHVVLCRLCRKVFIAMWKYVKVLSDLR